VTIASAAEAHSLKMDNYGGNAPVLINQSTLAIGADFNINDHSTDDPDGYTGPELDNQGTLTVGGAFNLNADSIVDNSGTINVDGKMEVLDQSAVNNSGTIKLAGGGDFSGESTISTLLLTPSSRFPAARSMSKSTFPIRVRSRSTPPPR